MSASTPFDDAEWSRYQEIIKLKAEKAELKARLKAIRKSWNGNFETECDYVLYSATDLRKKNWKDVLKEFEDTK